MKRIKLHEALGKTLTAHSSIDDEQVVLVFGKEYLVLIGCGGWDSWIDDDEVFFPLDQNSTEMVRLGLLTQKQVDDYQAKRKAEQAAQIEANDRAKYEELKKRFE